MPEELVSKIIQAIKKIAPAVVKAVGADGLIVEIHPNPEKALCDGKQSLNFNEFDILLKELTKINR